MRKNQFYAVFAILVCLVSTNVSPSYSAGEKIVAVLPFSMHADRDLGFLQEGILDMLSTRLTWRNKVRVVEKSAVQQALAGAKGTLDEKKAVEIGKALQADYVIMGSLTVFGESVSVDAKILDVSESKGLMTAFKQSKGMNEVIPTINQFAQDINDKILGRTPAAAPASVKAPENAGPNRPLISASSQEPPAEGPLVNVEKNRELVPKAERVVRLNSGIVGLDVGDVDGDGANEVVCIDKDTVYVYKWTHGYLAQIQKVKAGWSSQYVYVSVGDMDGNGRAEIYVSSMEAAAESLVYEWDGKQLRKIASGEPWFFRVTEIPGRGKVLLGQKNYALGAYGGNVEILKRKGDSFSAVETLDLPHEATVFNFVETRLGSTKTSTVLLDRYDRIRVYDGKGEDIWKSSDRFGGNFNSIQDKSVQANLGETKEIFIPPPIFLTDVDRNGEKELVICQNESMTKRLTEHYHNFSNGKVLFLSWREGAGYSPAWNSISVSGAVVGYALDKLDPNGPRKLIIASVTSNTVFTSSQKSQLLVYGLD